MPTHNKHIFVRPKKVFFLWEKCLFGEKALNFGSGGFRIIGIVYTVSFYRLYRIFLVFLVDFLIRNLIRNPPLPKISTFLLGQKESAYYEKSLQWHYECAYYEWALYDFRRCKKNIFSFLVRNRRQIFFEIFRNKVFISHNWGSN